MDSGMPLLFNTILLQCGVNPSTVVLLRHQDHRSNPGRTPYELWRDHLPEFEKYQSLQRIENRAKLKADYWACFVVTPRAETLFAGLYSAKYAGLLAQDTPWPNADRIDKAGECDTYDLTPDDRLSDFASKLVIEWGSGTRAWIQRAERQNKAVAELRAKFAEPEFPGCLNFIKPLSEILALPKGWLEVLRNTKGIYLLTCPKTKEQYVGSANGEGGFLQRWTEYVQTGHGGNVAMKNRNPSDYQVSILEVAGTAQELCAMEIRWKKKLQSQEMGLNKN